MGRKWRPLYLNNNKKCEKDPACVGEFVEKLEPLMQSLWKAVWSYLKKKKKMELLHDPAISLLGIYPKKPETLI